MTVLSPIVPSYSGPPSSTISWPTAREFQPSRMSWGVSTSRTAWASVYTGQTQRISHLADRLRLTLELPLALKDLAGGREAYFMAASAAGNWIRLHHFQRPQPLGTMRGTPVVAATQAANSREITLTESNPKNLLRYAEELNNAVWVKNRATITADTVAAPNGTGTAETLASEIDGLTTPRSVYQQATTSLNGVYTFSIYAKIGTLASNGISLFLGDSTGTANVRANFSLYTLAVPAVSTTGGWVSGGATVQSVGNGWVRLSITGTTNTAHTALRCYVWLYSYASVPDTTGSVHLWGAQLEQAAAATSYDGAATLQAGDVLGVANQLIQVGYGGAVADGAGAVLVPLVLPLRRAVSAGAAVTWDKPTGTFQILSLDPSFDYQAPQMQMGLTVELAEVYS